MTAFRAVGRWLRGAGEWFLGAGLILMLLGVWVWGAWQLRRAAGRKTR